MTHGDVGGRGQDVDAAPPAGGRLDGLSWEEVISPNAAGASLFIHQPVSSCFPT